MYDMIIVFLFAFLMVSCLHFLIWPSLDDVWFWNLEINIQAFGILNLYALY